MAMLLECFIGNCEKFNLEKSEKSYLHNPQSVSENDNHNLIWDMNIQCDNIILKRRPDIVIVNKKEKTEIIIRNNYRCCNTWGQKNNLQGKG